jgi:hypothetical protein
MQLHMIACYARENTRKSNILCFQYLYEVELVRTQSDNNTVASYPESLAGYNATGAMVIQEVGFTLPDNTSLTRSLQFIEVQSNIKISKFTFRNNIYNDQR